MADDDLAKRFENIFSKKPVANEGWDRKANINVDPDSSWHATDETSLEDLLEELGAGDNSWLEEAKSLSLEGKKQGRLEKDDSDAVNKLLADARNLHSGNKSSKQKKSEAQSLSHEHHETDEEDKANSDDEAEELLRQIQDGITVEDPEEEIKEEAKPTPSAGTKADDADDVDEVLRKRFAALESLNLPRPPSNLPTGTLGLPSAPTSKPVGKGKKKTVEQKVDDMMDEIEHWCCICNEDAAFKCLGCDGDLYCTECFNEGHRGTDAPLDMRKHKAMAYSRAKSGRA